ncbi:hypothetical protein H7J86_26235 [Mycobacterium hackensackense]|uniref:hypothetical protein n=1 Tax=Mycobacterium hackensackense TaxID=228909 RepID=UPI0022658B14|nr:hypothetical protein [Mycobacterium hackensackense]MCV7255668.1 hypothetical protein [Mycobacterium hackensackense]
MTERTRWRYFCRSEDLDGRELYNWWCPATRTVHTIPVDQFWPKPKPQPVEAIYLGSITIIQLDGRYYAEHRNADNEVTFRDEIGDELALNFQLLGVEPPKP